MAEKPKRQFKVGDKIRVSMHGGKAVESIHDVLSQKRGRRFFACVLWSRGLDHFPDVLLLSATAAWKRRLD